VSIGCFLLAIPQGIAAIAQLLALSKGARMPSRVLRCVLAFLLVAGTASAVGLGVWIRDHPPQPRVVTVVKTVEKAVPCPPTKSGPATTKGTQSPAISGSGNGVNYGTTPPPKKP